MRRNSTPVVLLSISAVLFAISLALLLLSGVSAPIALIWNLLSSLNVNYQLLSPSVAQGPLMPVASLIDAIIFALIAVALAALFSGWIKRLNFTRRLQLSKISKIKGHVVLVPYNDFARHLAQELSALGVESVTITEKDTEERELYSQKQLAVAGNPSSTEAFMTAGIARAKCVVACSDDDIQNAIITVTAKSANPHIRIIARVSDMDNIAKLGRAGATRTVTPEVSAGTELGNEIAGRL